MLEYNMIILLLLLGCHPATPKTSATVDNPGTTNTTSAPASAPDSTPTQPPLTINLTVTPPTVAKGDYTLTFDLGQATAGLDISIAAEFKGSYPTLSTCKGKATGNVFTCKYAFQWAGYMRNFQVNIGPFMYPVGPTCIPKPGATSCPNTTNTEPTADNQLWK